MAQNYYGDPTQKPVNQSSIGIMKKYHRLLNIKRYGVDPYTGKPATVTEADIKDIKTKLGSDYADYLKVTNNTNNKYLTMDKFREMKAAGKIPESSIPASTQEPVPTTTPAPVAPSAPVSVNTTPETVIPQTVTTNVANQAPVAASSASSINNTSVPVTEKSLLNAANATQTDPAGKFFGDWNNANKKADIDALVKYSQKPGANKAYVEQRSKALGIDPETLGERYAKLDGNIESGPSLWERLKTPELTMDKYKVMRATDAMNPSNTYTQQQLDAMGYTREQYNDINTLYDKGGVGVYSNDFFNPDKPFYNPKSTYNTPTGAVNGTMMAANRNQQFQEFMKDNAAYSQKTGYSYTYDPNKSMGQNQLDFTKGLDEYQGITEKGMFDDMTAKDWIGVGGQIVNAGVGLFNAYNTYQANKDAAERYKTERAMMNRNLANQAKIVNNRIDASTSAALQLRGYDRNSDQYKTGMEEAAQKRHIDGSPV